MSLTHQASEYTRDLRARGAEGERSWAAGWELFRGLGCDYTSAREQFDRLRCERGCLGPFAVWPLDEEEGDIVLGIRFSLGAVREAQAE